MTRLDHLTKMLTKNHVREQFDGINTMLKDSFAGLIGKKVMIKH